MPGSKNIVVACDLVDSPNDACKIKPSKVERLMKSIRSSDLLQPPGVVEANGRYRLVYGNHRFHAWQRLGHTEIEVRLLPPETTEGEELSISLQENHVREKEDFEDTLTRVETRAKHMGCSFKKAAEAENVNPAYVSRARKIVNRLGSEVIQKARENGIGLSILYVLSGVDESSRQMELLDSYLDGSLNRESLAVAVKKKAGSSARKVTIKRVTPVATFKVAVVATATYKLLFQQIAELRKQLSTCQKNGIPVKLLPEIMEGGADVVQKA